MFDFEYHVYDEVLEAMENKIKKIEIRLYNEKSSKIKIGDIIKFKCVDNENKYLLVKVTNLIIYEDVNDLIRNYDSKMYTTKYNKENIVNGLYSIFGKEEVDNHKIIGIEFELLNSNNTIVYFIRHSKPLKVNNEMNFDDLQLCNEKQILSLEGEKIAEETSLKEYFKDIDVLYSSNYIRAISTAKYIASINDLNINVVSDLGERKFGINTWEELPEDFEIKQFKDENYKIGTGECLNEVQNRMYNALIKILTINKGKKVCIVSHATAMTSLFRIWCNIIPNDGYYFNGHKFSNTTWNYCEIFKLEFDDDNNLINIINL